MKKFISKPQIIEAGQFLPPNQIPEGVFNVYELSDGVYSGQVRTIQGEIVNVKKGEWIVKEKDNPKRFYPVADKIFKEKYKPVNENEDIFVCPDCGSMKAFWNPVEECYQCPCGYEWKEE